MKITIRKLRGANMDVNMSTPRRKLPGSRINVRGMQMNTLTNIVAR
ncbi:MAG: hypothetical protein PHW11_09740 [Anaerolineaceae bacterium]|nr:hypothetical protein [Anaerolineaceae bacterium]MDD4043384.1 hypothetical protein [Anaerolineaceae bacterium]MDD4578474.1 hypothetical protein [Anaerolineaceae bacterium]